MDAEGVGNQEQVRQAWVAHRVLVSLDAPPVHADQLGESVLGEAGAAALFGDLLSQYDAAVLDPVGVGVASAGHSTNARPATIISQYPNGRFLITPPR